MSAEIDYGHGCGSGRWPGVGFEGTAPRRPDRLLSKSGETVKKVFEELFESGAILVLLAEQDRLRASKVETAFSVTALTNLPQDQRLPVMRALGKGGFLRETASRVGYIGFQLPNEIREKHTGEKYVSTDPFADFGYPYPLARVTLDYAFREPITIDGVDYTETVKGVVIQTSGKKKQLVFGYEYAGGRWAFNSPLEGPGDMTTLGPAVSAIMKRPVVRGER